MARGSDSNRFRFDVRPLRLLRMDRREKRTMRQKNAKSFDPGTLVGPPGSSVELVEYRANENIFLQGSRADALYYVKKGKVTITVRSNGGKYAVLAIFRDGDFFGLGCIARQPLRAATATTIAPCSLVRFEKKVIPQLIQRQPEFARFFTEGLLSRVMKYQEELVDCLFNSSEKRLARILLSLAHFEGTSAPGHIVPKISQQTMGQMVGTTRARVSHFMNKFRRLGFIEYNGGLTIHKSLGNVLLEIPVLKS